MTIYEQENWLKIKIVNSQKHQEAAFEQINQLIVRTRHGRRVTLTDNRTLIDFISCSYLGLDMDKRVMDASSKSVYDCGVNFAVSRTRMKAESFFELENLLNKLFCNSYTTTFASTHLAHLGVLPLLGSGEMPSFTLNSQGPLFIVDRTAHASIQINRGLLSQFGQVVITDFKSLSELEHYFKEANEHQKTPVALADGVGSMGDTVSVNELMEFAEKYHGYVYLDDAHGTSLFGKNGCGFVLDKLNHIFHPRLILVMSLSKGFGTNGGVVAVPTKSDEEIIKRFSTTYVFGNPPPLAIVDASIQSAHIHLSEEICSLQNSLRENIRYFDLHMAGFHKSNPIVNYGTELPIRGILVGEEFKAIACSKELMHKGYLVMAAIYPTVPKGKSMLRASLSSIHDKNDILNFCNSMKEVLSHQFN